jgi:hypothetical protein
VAVWEFGHKMNMYKIVAMRLSGNLSTIIRIKVDDAVIKVVGKYVYL